MLTLFVGFLIGAVAMWFIRRSVLRDARKKWETERAYLKYLKDEEQLAVRGCHLMLKTAARLRRELREKNDRLRSLAREVVDELEKHQMDTTDLFAAVERLVEELDKEQ